MHGFISKLSSKHMKKGGVQGRGGRRDERRDEDEERRCIDV